MEFEFRADREAHLRMLCEEMGRSVDDFVNEAVLTFMEDYEDGRDGKVAYKEFLESGEQVVPLEEVVARYGLEDRLDAQSREATGEAGAAGSEKDQQLSVRETRHAA
jgi:hypothetical protein